MNKREIIDHIRRLNPTAAPTFLADFGEEELLAYLRQLKEVEEDRRHQHASEPALAG